MSADGPGTREVAHRVFAAEFDDASLSYSESDEERAPNYVVTPTGARVNRLFVAGVLTEVERVNDETRRGRVVDPSGAFVTYAGQYQPEAQTFLERADPPAFVALTGKARTFEPEDSDRVFTSVRPESLTDVDADTRDRWVVSAAEATLDRLAVFAQALDSDRRGDDLRAALEAGGAPAALADGIPHAIAHYDTSTAYVEAVRRLAVDALELVAGDRDEVRAPEFAPDGGGDAAIGPLPETDVTIDASADADEADEADTEAGSVDAESEAAEAESEAVDAEPEAVDAESEAADPEPTTAATDAQESATEPAGGTEAPDSATEPESSAEATADADGIESEGVDDDGSEDQPSGAGLGDFDAGGDETDPTGDAGGEAASDDMYELDDEEREEIEAEYGTDFSTGTEVSEPGEADIDVPDPDDLAEEPADGAESDDASLGGAAPDDVPTAETDEAPGESTAAETDRGGEEADETGEAADIDLEAAAVDAMATLDDGEGADRETVVQAVVDEYGADADAVDDAIQDALMSGKCYEPGDGVLKPI
ncbi:hypothetical protein [Halorubrum sp. BV1]|uniref:hypothetical protein n=1 Tax=Halorubrum sp. BV1 TaxID=1498500 RepID=UPI000679783A|nr:hypothetical protein [Halorubrum sp. BV1]